MLTPLNVVLALVVLFCLGMAFSVTTSDFRSALLFRVVPGFLGLAALVVLGMELGFLIVQAGS
jgi:hypothetical protein